MGLSRRGFVNMFPRILSKLKSVAWFLPGFLLWAAYPPMAEKVDVAFALAPLIWLSRRGQVRVSARRWFANGLLFWIATISWMPAITANGGPWPLVLIGWSILAGYAAMYFGAFGLMSAFYWRWAGDKHYAFRLLGLLFVEPVLWAGLELLRSTLLGGFAWNHLGAPMVNAGLGAPASIGGIYLCSAMVVLVNGTIASIFERMFRQFSGRIEEKKVMDLGHSTIEIKDGEPESAQPARRFPPSAVRSIETFIPFALVFAFFYASSSDRPSRGASREDSFSVALVQRDFPCVFNRETEREDPAQVYSSLLERISPLRPSLVVLPESAFCEVAQLDHPYAARFAAFIREKASSKAVLAGGSRRDKSNREYNSAALYTFARDGSLASTQIYDKVHLVPFGEYIPGDKIITALQRFAPVGSCTSGELKTLDFNGIRLGVAICFEDTDSIQVRRLARMGAEALVFITNDSWFSGSVEPVQHYWQSVARAYETGLPVVRVGNSGVTCVINPGSRPQVLLDRDSRPSTEKGVMFEWVTPVKSDTFYVKWGDVPLIAVFSLLIVGLILIQYKEYYEKRRTMSM